MKKAFCLVTAVICAFLAYYYQDNHGKSLEIRIIKSWANHVTLPKRDLNRNFRVAIGTNTNVDLILSGTQLFKGLQIKTTESKNCQQIKSLSEFKECFLFFFRKGSAAERSFQSQQDFDHVIKATEKLEKKYFIGGNAGLMAESISNKVDETDVYLIGPIGPKLKDLLNKSIHVPYLNTKDEIHLILEYKSKEIFEKNETPTSNRFIVSHDIINSNMKMLDDFFNGINKYRPDLIILSGLHLLESIKHDLRSEKLKSLRNQLSLNSPIENIVHLELASIGDKSFMKTIIDINILHEINSLGLNEQELLFFSHAAENGPHSNYFNEITGQPDILKVIDILEWILKTYGKSETNPKSQLTRIHFHCLVFHIIVVKNDKIWLNSAAALMAGAKVASKQAGGLDFNDHQNEHDLDKLVEFKTNYDKQDDGIKFQIEKNQYATFNPDSPIIKFSRNNINFHLTPVLVCKKPVKTVGLGDAISSIGLLYSMFNH